MRYLLDTHALLWALQEPERLTVEANDAIVDPATLKVVSVASAWEVAIKAGAGKLTAPENLGSEITDAGFEILAIGWEHAVAAGGLPLHHKDPFDRMLIAQAQIEDLTILTRDRRFDNYEVAVLRA